jgi:hypothetical protein
MALCASTPAVAVHVVRIGTTALHVPGVVANAVFKQQDGCSYQQAATCDAWYPGNSGFMFSSSHDLFPSMQVVVRARWCWCTAWARLCREAVKEVLRAQTISNFIHSEPQQVLAQVLRKTVGAVTPLSQIRTTP